MSKQILNILLVEDDELDVMSVRRAFKKNSILNPLHVASNGVEALEMLRGCGGMPHCLAERRIILLDLSLPKMNGIEFLRELRGDPELSLIPVVVLTASDEECDKADAYRYNVAGYILKPPTLSSFIEMMATLSKYWMLCELP